MATQAWSAKFGQPTLRVGSVDACWITSVIPTPKNSEVQPTFSLPGVPYRTPWPSGVVKLVLLGASEKERSFQVMIGTIVSTRGSMPATANCTWPPYEPPTMPTRGSCVRCLPSCETRSRRT